jgi:hypothetical protein
MRSSEPALRAVRTQVQFELAEAAAKVAHAATVCAEAQEQVTALRQRCECAAEELRDAMGRSKINPALLATMRRVHRLETAALQDWQRRLAAAAEREQQARAELAGIRNRERSLERALRAEVRKQDLLEQTREMLAVDDLWLQHTWRTS